MASEITRVSLWLALWLAGACKRSLLSLCFQPLSEMNEEGPAAKSSKGGGKKRFSVERVYQRKTQLEHVLLRPDSYVGSVEETTQPMWVWDEEKEAIVNRPVTFVPGLYKIFDEILGGLVQEERGR